MITLTGKFTGELFQNGQVIRVDHTSKLKKNY